MKAIFVSTDTKVQADKMQARVYKNELLEYAIEDRDFSQYLPPELEDHELGRIKDYIPNIIVDLKYATTDNFTGQIIYDSSEAYLRYGTIKKLKFVQEQLNKEGYTIVIWDAYRPVEAQFKLWEICPDARYVANPYGGYSDHSRGNTLDISIATLDGELAEMPSGFDEFSAVADRNYYDVSSNAAEHARLLERFMYEAGFWGYNAEWWHYTDNQSYSVIY